MSLQVRPRARAAYRRVMWSAPSAASRRVTRAASRSREAIPAAAGSHRGVGVRSLSGTGTPVSRWERPAAAAPLLVRVHRLAAQHRARRSDHPAAGALTGWWAAYDEGRVIGFCLSYHYGSTTGIRAVAVALDRRHPAPRLYFNLMYHLPIEDAYAHGINALQAGITTIEAKRRRGAEVSGLYALVDRDSAVRHPGGGDGGGPAAVWRPVRTPGGPRPFPSAGPCTVRRARSSRPSP